MFAWQRPIPQFGGGGGSSGGGGGKMTKPPVITPSPTVDPWAAHAGLFQNYANQAQQLIGGGQNGTAPNMGPTYMNPQQLYAQGSPMAQFATAGHMPQNYQQPYVSPLGALTFRPVQ